MRRHRLWIWIAVAALVLVAVLPVAAAERYTSPTQDGKYTTNPVLAYRFVVAAIAVSPSAELNTSGEALERAKAVFDESTVEPTKVELLYLPGEDDYSYTTPDGEELTIESPDGFVWEVWGLDRDESGTGDTAPTEVVGFLDYMTGDLLAATIEEPTSTG